MNKQMGKEILVLFIITLTAGLLLGLVYAVTKEPIAAAQEEKKQEAYQSVFEDAASFAPLEPFDQEACTAILTEAGYEKDVIDEVCLALDTSGEQLGYCFTVTSKEAYGGSLQLAVGIRLDGTVNRIEFLSLSETMGLGMEAKQPDFYEQFSGKQVTEFLCTKSGASGENEIDALSGATITSNAVTNAVNSALCYFNTFNGTPSEAGGGTNE